MYKWHYSAPTEHVEADAFFCFTNLMSEIRDNFIKSLDDSACGIGKLHIEYCMCPSSNFASKCFKVLKPLLRNLPFFVSVCYKTTALKKIVSFCESLS